MMTEDYTGVYKEQSTCMQPSLVPRPLPAFNVSRRKAGGPGTTFTHIIILIGLEPHTWHCCQFKYSWSSYTLYIMYIAKYTKATNLEHQCMILIIFYYCLVTDGPL